MYEIDLEWFRAMDKKQEWTYNFHIAINADGSGSLAGFQDGGCMGCRAEYKHFLK